jgi:DNA-binding response OmpR family regulator
MQTGNCSEVSALGHQAVKTTTNTTILVLSSEAIVRSVIQDILETKGYAVLATGDLGRAVDWLKNYQPDLLIIRLYVEGMSGFEAATFLRTKSPGLRVLMLGGLIEDDRLKTRVALEDFNIFPKPITATDLLNKVRDMLP